MRFIGLQLLFEKRIIREDTKNACDIVRVLGIDLTRMPIYELAL